MSSSAMQTGIRCLRQRLAAERGPDESDEQLLHAFLNNHDEAAFAALVRRHGPTVLHVCRRVLGHEQDAEDAFQAVFLVLARNAASLRKRASLASFLHGTAYRTALKAKQSAARRRKHEGQAPARSPADPAGELLWREMRVLLDEEIAQLPDSCRSVFVLCCLENLSQAEAGRRLGLKERTVSNRLAAARERLSRQLARRGVELTAVLAAAALAAQPAAALPAGLVSATIKAALAMTAGEGMASLVSPHVTGLVKSAASASVLSKTKIVTAVLLIVSVLAGAGAWICRTMTTPQPDERPTETPQTWCPGRK
jgi:RNA polymerase sigma factor (sigma-70 family)